MKLLVVSDIHNEQGEWHPLPGILPYAEAVVLAGDIHKKYKGPKWIREVWPDRDIPVIYVAGNHEHWGSDIRHNLDALKKAAKEYDVAFLENGVHVVTDPVDGHAVRFLGCTLWTDFGPEQDRGWNMRNIVRSGFPDFELVRLGRKKFTPGDAHAMHLNSLRFLGRHMEEEFTGSTVVVTHHCPTNASIPKRFLGDPANCAFTTDLSRFIEKHKPTLWVHGHTHDAFDYQCYDTRVVCNPADYPYKRTSGKPMTGAMDPRVGDPARYVVVDV